MEDIINHIDGKVQVIFEIVDETKGTFRDAILFTEEEYSTISREDILIIQQERYNNWVLFLDSMVVTEDISNGG